MSLRFDLNVQGHANNTVVNNVARNLVSQFKVRFASETLQDTARYDLLKTYEDLFTEPYNKLGQGFSSENIRKLRTNAGDKDDSNTKEVTCKYSRHEILHSNRSSDIRRSWCFPPLGFI